MNKGVLQKSGTLSAAGRWKAQECLRIFQSAAVIYVLGILGL